MCEDNLSVISWGGSLRIKIPKEHLSKQRGGGKPGAIFHKEGRGMRDRHGKEDCPIVCQGTFRRGCNRGSL